MVEGSLWVYGQTRLTDYYAGRIGLRELANRLVCLPSEAPLWAALDEEQQKQDEARQASDIEDTLAIFKPERR